MYLICCIFAFNQLLLQDTQQIIYVFTEAIIQWYDSKGSSRLILSVRTTNPFQQTGNPQTQSLRPKTFEFWQKQTRLPSVFEKKKLFPTHIFGFYRDQTPSGPDYIWTEIIPSARNGYL